MEQVIRTKKGEVALRPALETEAEKYRNLRLEALQNHPTAFSSAFEDYSDRPLEYWQGRIRALGNDDMLFFAVHDDEFVGMCGIYRQKSFKEQHSATIVSMYIRPEWRGLGLAEALILHEIDWAKIRGVRIVKLGVISANFWAVRCYQKLGFTTYGVEPQALFYDGQMYDMLLMSKDI